MASVSFPSTSFTVKNTFISIADSRATDTELGAELEEWPSTPFKRLWSEPVPTTWSSEASTQDRCTDGGADTIGSLPPMAPAAPAAAEPAAAVAQDGTTWARLTTADAMDGSAGENWQRLVTADMWYDQEAAAAAPPQEARAEGQEGQEGGVVEGTMYMYMPMMAPANWQIVYGMPVCFADMGMEDFTAQFGKQADMGMLTEGGFGGKRDSSKKVTFAGSEQSSRKDRKKHHQQKGRFQESLIDLAKRAQESGEPRRDRELAVAVTQRLASSLPGDAGSRAPKEGGCPSCGARVKGHFKFCACCGASVAKA